MNTKHKIQHQALIKSIYNYLIFFNKKEKIRCFSSAYNIIDYKQKQTAVLK